ncbi:MAG: S8 family peptidase [Patescibacteria group bacterium]
MPKKIYISIFLIIIFFTAPTALAYIPSDPLYSQQNYLYQINVEKAWDTAQGNGVVVAVLDSGVDINHPDLKFNIWKNPGEIPDDGLDNDKNGYVDDINGWDFVANTPDPRPKFEPGYNSDGINHGTAIAGIIAAVGNNGKGISGVAFNAKIMPIRILSSNGEGEMSNLITAIKYAVNNGADIINLSLVGYDYSEESFKIIEWAKDKSVLIVVAAGNAESSSGGIDLNKTPSYPACYGNKSDNQLLLVATSVDANEVKSKFANYGACVDVAAPGENLFSLAFFDSDKGEFNDYYSYNWSGTSLSTALVSGAAALVKSKDRAAGPQKIISAIINNTDNIDEKNSGLAGTIGSGRLNVAKAVNATSTPMKGYVAKLPWSPAVYYIEANKKRHLFPNEVTYWSWYSGQWADQDVRTISQADFDSLKAGKNISMRPGVKLIKFDNSPRVYAVTAGSFLCHIVNGSAASALYGAKWQNRVVTLGSNVEADYNNDGYCKLNDNAKYPDGSLIQYQGSQDIWYIEKNFKRKVLPEAFIANKFKSEAIIKNVRPDMDYGTGNAISSLEENILIYNK